MRLSPLCAGFAFVAATSGGQGTPPQFRIAEDLRISGETESLVSFSSLLVGRDGRIVVPQGQDARLLVFDAAGHRIGAFGRKGNGPGEFRDLYGSMGWRADTLWIFEFNQRRLTFISHDLRLLRTQSTVDAAATAPPPANPARRVEMTNLNIEYLYADGSMLVLWSFGPQDPETFSNTNRRYVIINATGDVLRDVARTPPPAGRVSTRLGPGVYSESVPFAARPYQSVASDGARVGLVTAATMSGNRGSFTVTVVRSTGDTVFTRAYKFDGVRVPQAVRDSALEAMSQWGTRRSAAVRTAGEALAAKARPLLPTVFASVTSLLMGNDDTEWLAVYDPASNPRYRALDGKGNVIGEVVLPAHGVLASATRTQLWVIESNADGLPSIVRYKVQPAAR